MSRKAILLQVKILFGVACFGFIFYKLKDQFSSENIAQLKSTFSDSNNLILLGFTVALLFLNWGIESYKWQIITRSIERVSFKTACKSVLTGVCVGNLTPGRLGEFAGRILFFLPENRGKVSVTHFICGLTQLFITVLMGILALVVVLLKAHAGSEKLNLILVLCVVLLILLVLLVVNINRVYAWLSKRSFMQRFNLGEVVYGNLTLMRLLVLSLVRYGVFTSQYFLLLKIFGIDSSPFQVYCAIAVSFMLMSSIPMISFIEVAVRAAIAVMLFGQYQENSLQLISASTLLWIINIVIPSLVGYVFAVQENFQFRTPKKVKTA